jgi:hypothetical protein
MAARRQARIGSHSNLPKELLPMKRTVIALGLLVLTLFAISCATTNPTPELKGVVSSIEGKTLTVTPAGGGEAATVNMVWGTRVYWQNGMEAGQSVLTSGHPVQVWFDKGTKNASKIVIAH